MSASNESGSTRVITRFAPSPTGTLHVGSARTALFNYLYARQCGGKVILRIEDTDTARSKREYEDNIREGLAWLGLAFDETYRQSERKNIYRRHIDYLIEKGYAREVSESHDGVTSTVIRFVNPGRVVSFDDRIRGSITFDTKELGDFVIAKDRMTPLYHLAVVIDDFESGITDVIRGEDHISNTPRQILIQEALGAPRPFYAHIPLILAADRSKLSKRHGAVSLLEFRNEGYLPEAMVNFLALLGWHPDDAREIFSLEELTEMFSIDRVQKGGAIFDMEKLRWINHEHMKRRPFSELMRAADAFIPPAVKKMPLYSHERAKALVELFLERGSYWGELYNDLNAGEWLYLFDTPAYEPSLLVWKKGTPEGAKRRLAEVQALLMKIPSGSFSSAIIKEHLWEYATREGRGEVLWPFRVALSGKEKSPDPFAIAGILGKDETVARIGAALNILA